MQQGEVAQALTARARQHPKEARPRLVRFESGAGIVRVSHLHKATALEVLRSVRRVGDQPVTVHTLGTSGTVRAAIRKYLEPLPR